MIIGKVLCFDLGNECTHFGLIELYTLFAHSSLWFISQ